MTQLEPAHLILASIMANNFVLTAVLKELLDRSPDRKATAQALLHQALNRAGTTPIEGIPEDQVEALRDAIGAQIAALITSVLKSETG
jgi:hypothetical protein